MSLVCRSWRQPAQQLLQTGISNHNGQASLERYRALFPRRMEQSDHLPPRVAALDPYAGANEPDENGQIFLVDLCGTFGHLRELYITIGLEWHDLEDHTIAKMLQVLPTLEVLNLICHEHSIHIGATPVQRLPLTLRQGLPRLPALTCLYLEGVRLGGQSQISLPSLAMPHLRSLAIVKCDFDTLLVSWIYKATTSMSVDDSSSESYIG